MDNTIPEWAREYDIDTLNLAIFVAAENLKSTKALFDKEYYAKMQDNYNRILAEITRREEMEEQQQPI